MTKVEEIQNRIRTIQERLLEIGTIQPTTNEEFNELRVEYDTLQLQLNSLQTALMADILLATQLPKNS